MRRLAELLLVLTALAVQVSTQGGTKWQDRIINLPGLTFSAGFEQFSGYLSTSSGNQIHYWLVESQRNVTIDPLVIWLNNGPGCSALHGLFTEMGPFRVNSDGETLFENIYSWNKGANVLYLEGSGDIGFSYRSNPTTGYVYNDETATKENVDAIHEFFKRFPEFEKTSVYIAGEGYGGIYVLKLVNELLKNTTGPPHLQGIAVGNGMLSYKDQINSIIGVSYYHGLTGEQEFDALRPCCNSASVPVVYCDFSAYVDIDTHGNVVAKSYPNDPVKQQCATTIQKMSYDRIWNTQNDVYNTYQDCYWDKAAIPSSRASKQMRLHKVENKFVDQALKQNMASTDAQRSFPCWSYQATEAYLNQPSVYEALHISPLSKPNWMQCRSSIEQSYVWQTFDTSSILSQIFKAAKSNLHMLFFNGDLDTAHSFLGNEWFIERVANDNKCYAYNRTQWTFSEKNIGGYMRRYLGGLIQLDVLTVKGAGEYVALDRGGPTLQMINNLVMDVPTYERPMPFDTQPKQPLLQYKPKPKPQLTRKEADRVWNLPGITYTPNFKQYSGYLNPSKGNYIHYWLTESQASPSRDPLVLWLNGGPGCSSLTGLLTELGPFWPNPDDGRTLVENVYSWNKMANMLFIETPRQVGYSYQNMTENPDETFSDLKTAEDNFLAIMDFLAAYPEYQNRPFYISGESYAGVYIPTLVSLMIDMIQGGNAPGLNLKGAAIGNGKMSDKYQLNSGITLMYNKGLYGASVINSVLDCCPRNDAIRDCDFSEWVGYDTSANAIPVNDSMCANHIAFFGRDYLWVDSDIRNPMNIYEECYENEIPNSTYSQQMIFKQQQRAPPGFVNQMTKIDYAATGNQGGFQCFAEKNQQRWLQWQEVRNALHIPTHLPPYTACSDYVSGNYLKQNGETGSIFDHIIRSGYKLHMLIYSGDLDMICNFVAAEWFVEELVQKHGMKMTVKREPWIFREATAGYYKSFGLGSTFSIDVMTVKGAGHMVQRDRPGPALQMFRNFISQYNYSSSYPHTDTRIPLKPEFQNKIKLSKSYPIMHSRMAEALIDPESAKSPKTRAARQAVPKAADPPVGSKASDLMTSLPGVTFKVNFKQYSGYLNASKGNFLHYWFVESQGNPSTDPLLLWFNGGPGCSSLGGLLRELGPFRPNPDESTLFENVYSWNKVANVLFWEGPRDVGFSYRSSSVPPDNVYNDDKTASDNLIALQSFFNRFPEYKNRPFFISGESYAGVYTPTLVDLLIKKIQDKSMAYVNLKGLAIGNGELSELQQINSAPQLLYYRGVFGKRELDRLKPCCIKNGVYDNYCDLSQYITLSTNGDAHAKPSSNSVANECGKLVEEMGFKMVWDGGNNVYNTYQDCYSTPRHKIHKRATDGITLPKPNKFIDLISRINFKSTDGLGTFPCYMAAADIKYLNIPAVQKALHIPAGLPKWSQCNDAMNANYIQQHNDTTPIFESIIRSKYPLNVLIYNGDADSACNFLGDEWFVEALANKIGMVEGMRNIWNYTLSKKFMPIQAGFVGRFTLPNSQFRIDLLTVKGAGHFVPTNRAGPALQMIANFIADKSYSTILNVDSTPQPLLQEYLPNPTTKVTRMEADRVYDLPGVTFEVDFKQYSGYLQSTPGNYLHYWFVESQSNPATDPVVLWLNGGPGCTSLLGLFTEHGPFRPNPDGSTLFENVFAWNKAASILYLDSPRGVGFSWQNESMNPSKQWTDSETAEENAAAVADFFTVFEQYRKNDFYVSGESYAGIYIPMLTDLLIKRIQNGKLKVNLRGMAVGNGAFSVVQEVRANADFMYFHGIYGKDEWDALHACCKSIDGPPTTICDYERYVTVTSAGEVLPRTDLKPAEKQCGTLVASMAYYKVWNTMNDVFNLYQDCYQTPEGLPKTSAKSRHQQKFTKEQIFNILAKTPKRSFDSAYANIMASVNTVSTDAEGGFQCYMYAATAQYFSQEHVRDAIHVPDYVQPFQMISDTVGDNYVQLYNDSTPVFQSILNSGYKLRMLLYNGDADSACNIFEAEWFIGAFAKKNTLSSTPRKSWFYKQKINYKPSIAGYQKTFTGKNLQIDVLTVKGAGHYVPIDRPGPGLQMFDAFVNHNGNYDNMLKYSFERKPLLPQFQFSDQPSPTPLPTATTETTRSIEPVTTPITEPVTKPITEPVTKPVTTPKIEPASSTSQAPTTTSGTPMRSTTTPIMTAICAIMLFFMH